MPEEKPSEQRETNIKLGTHIWHRAGPHWWLASALTTAPSLLPQGEGAGKKVQFLRLGKMVVIPQSAL